MRQKPKLMNLTDAAAGRIKVIIEKSDKEIAGLRIGLKDSGCVGVAYTMEYAEAAEPGDDVVEDKGVTLFIDSKAVLFLLGTTMDYKTEKMSSQFTFDNPNQTSACGCGESVAITPVASVELAAISDSE